MPIQVPKLKQNLDMPESASAGRLVNDIPDASKEMAKTTNAFANAGAAVMDYQLKVEKDAADTIGSQKANEYEVAFKKGMYGDGTKPGVKFMDGDPAKLYSDFDEQMSTKFKELSEDPNIPASTSAVIQKKLMDRANSLNYQRLTEYGYQQNKYDDNVADSTVSLHKDRLTDMVSFIKPGDPATLAGVDGAVGDIRQTRLRQGLRNGSVIPDENGKSIMLDDDGKPMRVNVTSTMDYQIKKDLSDGIYNAMDNLIKSGDVAAAQTMRDKYADYIEPAKKKSIADDFLKASIDNRAYQIAAAGGKDMDKALEGLDDPVTREKVKDKALQIMNDKQRQQEQMRDRSSKQNYNLIATHVLDVQRKGGYPGVSALEADPVVKNAIDRVTDAKQRQAIYDMVEQPKTTNVDVKTRIQNVMFGKDPSHPDGFKGMDPTVLNQVLSGASKSDRDYYSRKFEQMNTATGAQDNVAYRAAGKSLEDHLQEIGYIKKDQYGHYSNADQIKITQARDQLDGHLTASNGAPMTLKEISAYTKDLAVKVKAGQTMQDVAAPAPAPRFQGAVNTTVAPAPQSGALVKGKTRVQWNQEYLKKGKGPATPDQLNKFIDSQD